MAGFGLTQYDKYVCKLQEKGYTVVVYEQDIQGKNTTRSLSEIISPGTYFSLDSTVASNNTMCIWLERSKRHKKKVEELTVGVSWIDIFTGKTSISQFSREFNHNPCTYDELERLVATNNPSECILVTNMDDKYLEDITHYANINCMKVHKISTENTNKLSEYAQRSQKQNYQNEIFAMFYPRMSAEHMFTSLSTHFLAIQSFTFLLDFIYRQNPNLVDKLSLPVFETSKDSLVLANHSLQQLNILDEGQFNGKLRSVSDLLDNCLTTMGKRSFLYKLHNPTTDVECLRKSYDITEHVLGGDTCTDYRNMLGGIHDLEKLKRKIILKKVTPKDFSVFVDDLRRIISLDKKVRDDKKVAEYVNGEVRHSVSPLEIESVCGREIGELNQEMITELEQTFHLDKCLEINSVTNEHLSSLSPERLLFIKPGISQEIDGLLSDCLDSRNKLVAISAWLSKQVGRTEKSTKTSTFIKIHETSKSDPMLLGTKRRVVLLKNQLERDYTLNNDARSSRIIEYKDFNQQKKTFAFTWQDLEYVSHGSNKKDLVITNPEIRTLASNIQLAETKLVTAVIAFYRDYIQSFVKYQETITYVAQYVTCIDILQCKVYTANKYNYCKPELVDSDKAFFSMKDIRHPLIEHLQTNELYVPNDVEMGKDIDGILLYGTNAVGKTSLIKAIGINVIMAQAGLYVACSRMEYFPYQSIFTRILGNDNIFKGLSTFEVEMSELSTILKLADENSLILGDELCSGTESDSALSIFTASLDRLHTRRSTFVFATHFHEIQNYEEIKQLGRLKSKHMEVLYNREKDVLVYDRKLRDGSGDSMYGLEVCKSLHLPDDFLHYAHDIRTKYNNRTKSVLDERGSHFNAKKLGGLCEKCGVQRGTDTHHLQHQKYADDNNLYIGSFHKNHKANLMNLCGDCHRKIHEGDEQHIKVRTSEGYSLQRV